MGEHFTDTQMTTFELKWEIRKIIALIKEFDDRESRMELDSPFFLVRINDNDTKWHLRIVVDYPDDEESSSGSDNSFSSSQVTSGGCSSHDGNKTTICFYIVRQSGRTKPRMRTVIESYLFTDKKGKFWECSEYFKIHGKKPNKLYTNNSHNFMLLSGINKLSDSLQIVCQINVIGDIVTSEENCFIQKVPEMSIIKDLAELLRNEKLSDVTFIVGNERIKAHRAILAARSPVFAALFDNPMRERSANEVEIEDIDADTFKMMLQYIYTNEIDDMGDGATKLLYAADKYALESLKEICGISIWQKITVNNSVEALIFADRHNLHQLVEFISGFLKSHISDVIETAEYEAMEIENPHLANKILRKILQNRSSTL